MLKLSFPFGKRSQTRPQTHHQNKSQLPPTPSPTRAQILSESPQTTLTTPDSTATAFPSESHQSASGSASDSCPGEQPSACESRPGPVSAPDLEPPTGLVASLLNPAKRLHNSKLPQLASLPCLIPGSSSSSSLSSSSLHPPPALPRAIAIDPVSGSSSSSNRSRSRSRSCSCAGLLNSHTAEALARPIHEHKVHSGLGASASPSLGPGSNLPLACNPTMQQHPSPISAIRLPLSEGPPTHHHSSAVSPPPLSAIDTQSGSIHYSHLSLLRRHHTLSTGSGSRLARLEKQHALATMGEKDRRFYGASSEAGSLSGSESLESLSLENHPTLSLTPLELGHNPAELSDLLNQPHHSAPGSASRNTLSQSSFQLIRAYKGSASLLNQDLLGSPTEFVCEGTGSFGTTYVMAEDALHSVPPRPIGNQLGDSASPPSIKHRPTADRHENSGSFPLYSQGALHRNISSPSKLQQSGLSRSTTPNPCYPNSGWGHLSALTRTMDLNNQPDPTRQQHQFAGNQSDPSHSLDQTPDEAEELVLPSPSGCAPASSLHRATSDRVSSTASHLNASQSPGSGSLTHWPEQASLRRHQSMKSDGRWGTCLVTGPNSDAGARKETGQPKDSSRKRLDTFYELESPIGSPTTSRLFRSASNQNNQPSSFPKSMPPNSGSSTNPPSLTNQSAGSVGNMSSPVSMPGFSINPWSPSVEEAKKLREPMLRQASMDTLASGRSTSPRPMSQSEISRFRSSSNDDTPSKDLKMLHTSFSRMNLSPGKSTQEELAPRSAMGMSQRISGAKSPLSNSTSMADLSDGATSMADVGHTKPAAGTTKKVVLPPLVTDFSSRQNSPASAGATQAKPSTDSAKRKPSNVSLPFQGPASAAAFVPPIGHSIQRNLSDPFSLHEKLSLMASHNTAAPGIGASTWLSQKERLVGGSQARQMTGEWGSPMLASTNSPLPSVSAPLSALPHQLHQQLIINQQLQQLQQLQAQHQLLQQQQVQLLNSSIGLPPNLATPLYAQNSPNGPGGQATGFNVHPMNGVMQSSNGFGYNSLNQQGGTSPGFGGINGTNPAAMPAPNPSRLQTTITSLPGLTNLSGSPPHLLGPGTNGAGPPNCSAGLAKPLPPFVPVPHQTSPGLDISELARQKGYNPTHFDLNPKSARFFVIKSYTEEDVHKSLKYEIWASTDLGNKRLDRAFGESADKGPVYLLFSVNASGHFCGMAEMLTAVDYNTSSKVWAQDKWKGIFKVRWVFVKDVPNNALRHIKLTNTPENKPVTSSRDTQEVPLDKGVQVLQIMSSYQSRTSLLQDYAWYEHNECLKAQQQSTESADHPSQLTMTNYSQPNHHHQPSADQSPPPNGHQTGNRHVKKPGVAMFNSAANVATQNIRRFTSSAAGATNGVRVPIEIASVI